MDFEFFQLTQLFAVTVGLFVAAAAVSDFRTRRIPNAITVPAAAFGLLFHALVPGGWGITVAATGLLVGFVLLLVPHFLGGGGMGDVKLLAALGAWLGPALLLITFVTAIFAAAAMITVTTIYQFARRRFAGSALVVSDHAPSIHTLVGNPADGDEPTSDSADDTIAGATPRERSVPFALPVAFATWCVLAWFLATRGF